jgi:hypothetical protein
VGWVFADLTVHLWTLSKRTGATAVGLRLLTCGGEKR